MTTEERETHYKEYTWATKEEHMREVKVEGDKRTWFYTAKKMYRGEMYARVIGFDESTNYGRKKLVPMSKIVFV